LIVIENRSSLKKLFKHKGVHITRYPCLKFSI
jgi:hypothetical protein